MKRWMKFGLIGIAVVAIMALALVLSTESASAQGGQGGRGNRGGNRGGNGGFGLQTQTQTEPGTNCLTGDCLNYGANAGSGYRGGNGTMNGAMNQNQMGGGLLTNLPPAVEGPVPADVVSALEAGLQDEVNAYATYQAVIDQLGAVRPFTAIQSAEAQHIAALEFLFERYGLALPAEQPTIGTPVFASLSDACSASAAAEIANFGLYDKWLSTVSNYPDMVQVFTALRNASEFQHLIAFERCAG